MEKITLTHPQKRILNVEMLSKASSINNIPCYMIFPKNQETLVKQAVDEVLPQINDVHLRFSLTEEGGLEAYYVPYEAGNDEIQIIDMKGKSEEFVKEYVEDFVLTSFGDVFHNKLFQFKIISTDVNTILCIRIHHLICDGTGIANLKSYVVNTYEAFVNGKDYKVPINNYLKYIEIEDEYLKSQECINDQSYWKKHLEDLSECPEGITNSGNFSSKTIEMQLSEDTVSKLRSYAHSFTKPISPLVITMGLMNIFVARYYNSKSVVLSTAFSNRIYDNEINNSIGMLVSTVPLKMEYDSNCSLSKVFEIAKAELKQGLTHSKYPYDLIFEDINKADIDTNKLANFSIVSNSMDENEKFVLNIAKYKETYAPFNIRVNWNKDNRYGLQTLNFEFRKDCFSENEMEVIVGCFRAMIEDIIENPDKTCGEIRLLSKEEEQRILEISKGEEVYYDKSATFISQFREQAKLRPENIAVVDEISRLTYQEADEYSENLAKHLVHLGVESDSFIAVMLPRRKEFILGVLATMKAGCAYIPIDNEYPQDRIDHMLSDSGAKVLITTRAIYEDKGVKADQFIFIEEFDFKKEETDIVLSPPSPETLAYMIYTSGSTGKPKGVKIRHKSLVAMVNWFTKENKVRAEDKICCYCSLSFDASVIDIFPPLSVGGELHIASEELRFDLNQFQKYLSDNKIYGCTMSTQVGMEFLNQFESSLHYINLGGEKLLPVKKTNTTVYNGYGPTEFTVCSSFHEVDQESGNDNIPIGKPVPNSWSYVVDDKFNLVPMGVAGELCLSGAQISQGYHNREDLTNEKFINNPYRTCEENEKMYRTGDLVCWNKAGELEYLGRIDSQVKLRGYRIELGEIESVMSKFEGITGCIAQVRLVGKVQHICGYYTNEKEIDIEKLKQYLQKSLAAYMVPTVFVQLDKIPLTPNGKVDKKVLPDPVIAQGEIVKPRDNKEQIIYDSASELVGNDNFGVTDDLFTVGLTSLMAIKLAVLLKNKSGIEVSTSAIIKGKTIENISQASIEEQNTRECDEIFEKRAYYPLTQNQLGVYFDCEKNPNTLIYNLSTVIEFSQVMDVNKLKEAVIKVVNAHPYIKTQLSYELNNLVQFRRDEEEVNVEAIKMEQKSMEEIKKEFQRPFTLLNSNLYRFLVVEDNVKTYLLFDLHHIIFDGGSVNIFIGDLRKAYRGEELDGESATAFDVALIEEKELSSQKYEDARKYFQKKLEIEATNLEQTAMKDGKKIGEVKASVNIDKVKDFCRKYGVTASNLFMASLIRVLSTYTREESIGIGTISNGRGEARLANTFGMFVKTLPATCKIEKEKGVIEFIKEVQEDAFETIGNEIYPLAQMSAQFGFHPSIIYAFQGGIIDNAQTDLKYKMEHIPSDTAKMPLTVNVFEEDQYSIHMEYDGRLYNNDYILSLVKAMKQCVEYFIENPDKTCGEIRLLSKEEEQRILEISKGEEVYYDKSATFISQFREQAKLRPENIAVVDEISRLTYQEADEYSENLAKHFVHLGVESNSFIAVMLPRRKEFILSVLATMKAGCAYIPIDNEYPQDRIDHMLSDSGAKVLITTRAIYEDKGVKADRFIFIEEFDFNKEETDIVLTPPSPETLAYMIYTSGSTGKPKGVKICQKSLVAMVNWFVNENKVRAEDKICCYCSLSFDASVIDIFPALSVGGELHIASEELRFDLNQFQTYLSDNKIYGCTMSTQVGMEFLNQFEASLQYIILGGEKLLPVKKTNTAVYNAYGPTEFTVCSSFHEVDQDSEYDNIPIGRPVPNSWSYVVDDKFNLVPMGVAGELCQSGVQISLGYHNREDLTKEKFINNPYKTCEENEKMYRTGDLVCWNKAGELEYLGRIDSQVKLRGYRIELGEIESVMSKFEGITGCIAEVRLVGKVQHICGYYTQEKEIDIEKLKQYLQKSLAAYMVPTAFVQLDKMPLTPNGKVNKKALPDPVIAQGEIVKPRDDKEQIIYDSASELVGNDNFGVTDDLFTVGLTSLMAIKLAVLLKNKEGVEISTTTIIKGKTIENIAKASADEQDTQGWNEISEIRDYYPLTQNQLGVYFDCEKNPNSLIYNIPMSIEFSQVMDVDKLKDALIKVVNAHPYIKTQLSYEQNKLVQLRRDKEEVKIETIKDCERSMEEIKSEFLCPFTLLNSNLYRFLLVEAGTKMYLFFDIHHIISDGGSVNIFVGDLLKAYTGEEVEGESTTAFDVALKEEKEVISEKYEKSQEYFRKKLEIESSKLEQTSIKDGKKTGEASAVVNINKVKDFCRKHGITASNLFMAAFFRVLGTYTREDSIGIGTISNGRGEARLANTFGMFVKTLPATCKIEKEKRIIEFIQEVQKDAFETVENEIYPLTQMSEQFGFHPSIIYVFQGGIFESNRTDLEYKMEGFQLDTVKMPLNVNVYEKDQYEIHLEYDGGLYNYDYMNTLAQGTKQCVEYFIDNPDKTCGEIRLLSKEEEQRILEISKGEEVYYDKSATFISQFREQAKLRPENVAVVDEISRLTYQEADEYSEKLAKHLVHLGVESDSFIAVMLPRRKEFILSVLATMKAGCAYIPIDNEYPQDRIDHMLSDSGAKVLITTRAIYEDKGVKADRFIFVEEFDFKKEETDIVLTPPSPETLAYMIYTSGSTGKPKGVKIRQKSLVAMVNWFVKENKVRAEDKICGYCSLSFDASVLDIFPALSVGGELHIASEEMRFDLNQFQKYLSDNKIYGCTMSTQVGMEFLNQFESSLQYINLGGEKLLPVKKTNTIVYNGYGPTEFTVCSSFHEVDQDSEYDNIPIGKPVPNSWSYVVDDKFNLVPIGVAGELCLSGVQISQGYHNREDLTNEKFINNPYKTCEENEKMYRTGDLVCWNKAGELEYLGRIDSQVKLRGYRIELGEIESVMSKFEGITGCIAEVRLVGKVQHICGYYTQEKEIDIEKLKQYLQKSLAAYMVPTAYVLLDKIPLTPNGKVNKKALPDPTINSTTEYIAPRNTIEKILCQVFEELLNLDKVGIDDDFFLLGGSSLLAMSLVAKSMEREIGIVYGDVFKCKTPRKINELIEGAKGEEQVVKNSDESQYDYKDINEKLLTNCIQDISKVHIETHPLGDILLTGATGFLGIHVLKEIIENYPNKVFCLVREKKNMSGQDRLKSLLHFYFEKDYEEFFDKRIFIVNGDATKPETIHVKTDTVINCAANVKHFAQGDELDQINIGGVINLIDYCKKNDATLIQVSTISVGGNTKEKDCQVVFSENMLYFGQDLENKYIYSKFMAERYVLEAVTKGLKAKIMRVGNLMARDSDGEFQINLNGSAFMSSLRAYKLLGAFPISAVDEFVEFSPIDLTAKAVLKLSETEDNYTIYHPVNTHMVHMYDVIATMNDYGFKIDFCDNEKFISILQEKMKDENVLKFLLGILAYQTNDKTEQLYKIDANNKFTSNILIRLGFRWSITSEEYIKKAIEALDGLGYFDVT